MKEILVLVCWVAATTVLLLFTKVCQSEVPPGIDASLIFYTNGESSRQENGLPGRSLPSYPEYPI
jgi:hypothetical protein